MNNIWSKGKKILWKNSYFANLFSPSIPLTVWTFFLSEPKNGFKCVTGVLPKRRRNAPRRSHRQLRTHVGFLRRPTLGPAPHPTGSGPSLRHGSRLPQKAIFHSQPRLCLSLSPMHSNRRRSRRSPLRRVRRLWSQQPHRRRHPHRSL